MAKGAERISITLRDMMKIEIEEFPWKHTAIAFKEELEVIYDGTDLGQVRHSACAGSGFQTLIPLSLNSHHNGSETFGSSVNNTTTMN